MISSTTKERKTMPELKNRRPIATYFKCETINDTGNYPKVTLCADLVIPVFADINATETDLLKESIVNAVERCVSLVNKTNKGAEK